jgi:two-component system, NtrC family, sensor kinase
MLTIPPSIVPGLYIFGIPALILSLCFPLWIFAGWVAAVFAAIVATVCFFTIRSLLRQISIVREEKCSLDEQLIQTQKLAAIGELSAGIAHEINNPLAIIAQEIEWARYQSDEKDHDEASAAELKDSLNEIAVQVERCREITHKLLDFARKKDPLIQGVDINRLIEDMARLVEREATQKNISIIRQYSGDLPPVHTDPPLIRQVILNLLNNATYAIGQNGTIEIKTRLLGGSLVELAVSDTGCGIAKENLSKVFDPFFTTKPPGKGTGLGLSICHGIIVRLGGRIAVESELGKGTSFFVRIPVIYQFREIK